MNVTSWSIMEKNGMRREGKLRENVEIRRERRDSLLYSILRHEYSANLPHPLGV
jgi:RimJ/RimL family protein N-acetyltransferase